MLGMIDMIFIDNLQPRLVLKMKVIAVHLIFRWKFISFYAWILIGYSLTSDFLMIVLSKYNFEDKKGKVF